jgi:hypothetical protein
VEKERGGEDDTEGVSLIATFHPFICVQFIITVEEECG